MAVDVTGKGEEERLIWRFGVGKGGKEGGEKRQNGGRKETAWPWCISSICLALASVVALIFREVQVQNKRK